MKKSRLLGAACVIISSGFAQSISAATIFFDDFDSGASPLWGNERGNWTAAGGVYQATSPDNNPITYSGLPFDLTDFSVSFDVNGVDDGGVWLRSQYTGTSHAPGILFVTGGSNNTVYWHEATETDSGAVLNQVAVAPFSHVEIVVSGNTYSAYLDHQATPTTTLVSNSYSHGRVAFYDFSAQNFDNVSINAVPLPATFWLLGSGVLGLIGIARRKKAA